MRCSITRNAMTDPAPLRHRVDDILARRPTGGETQSQRLIHPDDGNHTAPGDRQRGPAVAAATSDWLYSCLGDLGMIMQIGMCDPVPRPDPAGRRSLQTDEVGSPSPYPLKAGRPVVRGATDSARTEGGCTTPPPMAGRTK